MAENSTIETILFPPIPKQREINTITDAAAFINEQNVFNLANAQYSSELYNILHSGYLVRSFQVQELTADKITGGTIAVNNIFLGSSKFEIDGVLSQIRVKDQQPTPVTRVEIGAFGAGADYGIKIRDSSGKVVLQATSTTFIDGVAINNGTIDNSKISGVDGSKLAQGSVPNTAITSLSASKITLSGTLTCSGSGTVINVTGSGAMVFSGGGDSIYKASGAGDNNFISFRTSANSERMVVTYNPSTNLSSIATAGASSFQLSAAGTMTLSSGGTTRLTGTTVRLGTDTSTVIDFDGRVGSNINPSSDNTRTLGTTTGTTLRWADVKSVLINGADFCFENHFRITEMNHVWQNAQPHDGIVFLNDLWQVIAVLDRDGNLRIAGFIDSMAAFARPDISRRESPDERKEALNAGTEKKYQH